MDWVEKEGRTVRDIRYFEYTVGSYATINGGRLTSNSTDTNSVLGASYVVIPTLKIRLSSAGSKASADNIAKSEFTQYGAFYTMGQIDSIAQTAKVNDKNTVI